MSAAIATQGLGKRYSRRRRWALRDCTLDVPIGVVAGLIGPNGAGKTTLLHLAAGLLRPTAGTVEVLGRMPGQEPDLLPRIGFVAQDVPLYRTFSVRDMLEFGRRTNARWDGDLANGRTTRLGIPLDERVGNLSGGQRAQLGLALAMAKRPELLLLDEPLASLDPLARREFLQTLMEGIAEAGTTVILSSHLVSDLERVCDYVIVLQQARTQVAGRIDELLEQHRMLRGPHREDAGRIAGVAEVVQRSDTPRQTSLLVRRDGAILDPAWEVSDVGLEELVLAYLGQPEATALPAARFESIRREVSR
jgi:ABC-2 type transport system ATP-binding protein